VHDRVGDLDVGVHPGLAVAGSPVGDPVAVAQDVHLALDVVGTPLVSMPTFSMSGPIAVILS
jgi:hypothetical protein